MRRKQVSVVSLALAGGVAALVGSAAWAQGTPEGIVEYRQSLMSAQGGHVGAIARVVRGEAPFTDHVLAHAQALQETAALIVAAFPPGTGPDVVPDTRALPSIWENPEGFAAAATQLETASAALAQAAQSGDPAAIAAAFGPVGQACGTCHENFRAPNN